MEWKRPIFNSIKDLYIPLNTKLILERDTKLSDTLSDVYQLKFTACNTAVNNFGSKAQKPVFNWFESDELQSNLSVIVKLPCDNLSSTVYSVAWYGQFLIFINEKTTLNNALDFQIDTEKSWNSKATTIYSRPAKKSFLVDMTKYFVPDLKDKQFQITQKETVNLQAGKNTVQYYSVIDYLHTSSILFMKNYSLDFGIGTTFTWNQFTASTMAINLKLSGKMKF